LVWCAISRFGMGAAALAAVGGLRREGNGRRAVGAVAATASVSAVSDPPVMPGAVSPADYISMPRAGFWLRTSATVLDVLLFVFVLIVSHEKVLWFWLGYHVAMWAWKGTTVGGMVVGIKLVRVDGRPVDVGVALVRAAAAICSALVLGLGF